MAELFTIENLITLVILTALETVLGFDNLLYISIEAKRVPPEREKYVRRVGIALAIGLRIVLLVLVLKLIDLFKDPIFSFDWGVAKGTFSGHSLIVLLGGVFLLYTALKEIFHMLSTPELQSHGTAKATRTVASALIWILLMNVVFSFDTVVSAVALTDNFVVMATAIVVSGVLMIVLAEHVAAFLKRNRMYEVLGLFVLLLVAVMLMSEGGHLAHLAFFGYPIEPLAKSTFYFVVAALVVVDVIQGRYQKRILAEQEAAQKGT